MRTLLIVVLLCCAACDSVVAPTLSPVPALPPTPVGWRTLAGTGSADTGPFTLGAGDYAATWHATNGVPTTTPCYFTVDLNTVTDQTRLTRLFDTRVVGPEMGGTGAAYAVPAARYYLHVTTACVSWAVTLAPRP